MKMARGVAAAFSFAHLIGLGKRAEDDEDKKAKRAAEEEDEQASRSDGDDEQEEEARADEQDGDADEDMQSEEEDEQDGDEKGKGKKARKAKSKAEEEGDDDEKDGDKSDDKSARSAARRERARCAKIIAHGITTGRVRQAGVLAFDTSLSVKAAIATLDAGSADKPEAGGRKGLADRMAETNVPNVSADGGGNAQPGMTKVAAAIIAAGEKARGETAKK